MHPRTKMALARLEELNRDPKPEGSNAWRALCPAHDDHNPSLTVTDTADGPKIKCWSGCSRNALKSALFPDSGIGNSADVAADLTLTLEGLSEKRMLPLAVLQDAGVEVEGGVVRFTYRDPHGQTLGTQCQRGYSTKAGVFWETGSHQAPYGLWRPIEGTVWVTEGCANALSLWAAGEAAIGIPGASMTKLLNEWPDYLNKASNFIVLEDPDPAGRKFAVDAVAALKSLVPHALVGKTQINAAFPGHKDANDLLTKMGQRGLQNALNVLKSKAFGENRVMTAASVQAAIRARVDRLRKGGLPCDITTGFPPIDTLNGGANHGQQLVIGAYSGVGKSMLAVQVAHHVAKNHGPVLMASWEMTEEEVCYRALGVSAPKTAAQAEQVADRMVELAELPLLFTQSRTLEALEFDLRRLAAEGTPPRLLVADYLQLGCGSDAGAINEYVNGFKGLAMRFNLTTLIVSQLRRPDPSSKGEDGYFPTPTMHDMHGSSGIEKSADILGILHVDQYGHFFKTLKNRHGECPEAEHRLTLTKQLRFA